MITGYNTDVEYDGVVYHVQTEDKGVETPIILTLVYVRGAILASKRAPYDDLVARGFDEDTLRKRLQRQHKLICAAVHAGRIDDLKRMSEREGPPAASADQPPEKPARSESKEPVNNQTNGEETAPDLSQQPVAEEEDFAIQLIDEPELRGGQSVTLRVRVTRAGLGGRQPAAKVPVVVKTLRTNFTPDFIHSVTDSRGVASVSVTLPNFKSGRAAILIQAEENGEIAELRRIIVPAKG